MPLAKYQPHHVIKHQVNPNYIYQEFVLNPTKEVHEKILPL